jgi:hypothetical protein
LFFTGRVEAVGPSVRGAVPPRIWPLDQG